MLKSTCCPDLAAYRKLTSGQLSVAETETLLRHLETCDSCAGKIHTLPASDVLIDWLGQIQSSASASDEKQLMPLMERLIQLAKPSASPSVVLPSTLRFSCSGCGKPLRVKAEAAGKKVKCPHCGQVIPAPPVAGTGGSGVAPVGSVGMETVDLASAAGGTSKASPPSETPTLAAGPSGKERELCSFLAPSQAPDELGRLGPYRVLKVLGAGGMGVVFRAEDPQLQRVVAIKAMLPALAANESARQRFLREARLAASLKHDHIVTIHQVGEDRGAPFLAMEFLEGEALEDRLKREGQLPLAEVLRIGREIAGGLEAAHEHGLIHRDIKPANVWLEGKRGRVKILDFGLARSSGEDVHLTQSGAIVGTPAYMPPEQARGEKVDGRCDLYSLGCVLYRLCTGQLPFQGDNTMSLLLALATEQPKPVRELNADVPPALADLIMRLLSKEPTQRPATAGDVAQAFQDIAVEKSPTPEAARPPAPPRRRRKLLWAAAAGAFLVAAVLTVIVIVRNKQGDEIARLIVPENGTVEIKDKDRGQKPPKRQGGRDEQKAAKIPPPMQIPEPPPLAEWLRGRKVLTVSQDGSGQFKTIQAALNALKPHQVVKVLDRGPYRELFSTGELPQDTGLISEQQTVLECTCKKNEALNLVRADGFRLSGFRLQADPSINQWGICRCEGGDGLVIENCYFGWTKPKFGAVLNLDFENKRDCKVVLRDCFFDSGLINFWAEPGNAPTLVLQRNYFKNSWLSPVAAQFQKIVIRQNVFIRPSGPGPWFNDAEALIWFTNLKQVSETLEISNNTFVTPQRSPVLIWNVAPKSGIVIRNNCSDRGIEIDDKAFKDLGDSLKNWQLDHNCYVRRGSLPKAPSDVVEEPPFLSLDPSHPDFLRITADGPAAKGGAGGAWPSYIGALPPGPAPKDGDWFTRLREKWMKDKPAANKKP